MATPTARETLLEIIRTGLRRQTTALDQTELVPLIEAAKLDLATAGVAIVSESDPLCRQAIKLYAIYHIEWEEAMDRAYQRLKDTMALDKRYRGDEDVIPREPC